MDDFWASQGVALAVAVLALVGAGASALVAREAVRATRFVARSDRYAEWQMYKRKIYAELLASLRAFQGGSETHATAELVQRFDVALLAASDGLRRELDSLLDTVTGGGKPWANEGNVKATMEKMRQDLTQ